MRYLLDTHAFLWLATNSPLLSPKALAITSDANNMGYFSMISLWELGIKASIGKIVLPATPEQLERLAIDQGLLPLHLTSSIVSRVMTLPWRHKDPFDRIIVASALEEGMTLLSKDPVLKDYGVSLQW